LGVSAETPLYTQLVFRDNIRSKKTNVRKEIILSCIRIKNPKRGMRFQK